MATITLSYDEHNAVAKKTIEHLLSLGVFKIANNGEMLQLTPEMQKSISAGIADCETGKCFNDDDFEKEFAEWFKEK